MPVNSNSEEVSTLQFDNTEEMEVVSAPKDYLATEYMINEETGLPIGDEAPEVEQESSYDLEELAKKLGIDVSKLEGLVNESQAKSDAEGTEGDAEGEKKAEPESEESEEIIKKRLATVDSELKQLLGAGLTDVYGLLKELTDFRNQYYTEQQLSVLKNEWGDTYESNMQMVHERWAKLPQDKQGALNNVDGARLLLALIEKEQGQKTSSRTPNTPKYVKSSSSGQGSSTGKIRMSDVMKMSEAEYRKNEPLIQKAIREGRVIRDY